MGSEWEDEVVPEDMDQDASAPAEARFSVRARDLAIEAAGDVDDARPHRGPGKRARKANADAAVASGAGDTGSTEAFVAPSMPASEMQLALVCAVPKGKTVIACGACGILSDVRLINSCAPVAALIHRSLSQLRCHFSIPTPPAPNLSLSHPQLCEPRVFALAVRS